MRKILALAAAFALLLALFSCGRVEPEPIPETTAETASTTETETTTETEEAEFTIPTFVPASGESNGVCWRTLDLEDAANAEVKAWLEEKYASEASDDPREYIMNAHKKIVDTRYPKHHIVMVEDNGKETLLLEPVYFGEATTPKAALMDELYWKSPVFRQALDDRYFLVYWGGWECTCGYGIYDTKKLREIPIEYDGWMFAENGVLYSYEVGDQEPYSGPMHLWKYDWRAIVRGEPMQAKDVLADFAGPEGEEVGDCLLTEDARYFLAIDGKQLRVYNLAAKKLNIVPIPALAVAYSLAEWNGKVYWENNCPYIIEITLP
ncbi:MAG: hypothetical protein FWF60_06505 [Oscillospiraceae bacterium]|nr:hypothetical protein [Oscillospiraceae bacterium]